MPTLYVENVPEDLYAALRERAAANRASISAEVLGLLRQNVPTETELAARKEFLRRTRRLRARSSVAPGPTTEQMQREDRAR
jgi:plasmid stability protein